MTGNSLERVICLEPLCLLLWALAGISRHQRVPLNILLPVNSGSQAGLQRSQRRVFQEGGTTNVKGLEMQTQYVNVRRGADRSWSKSKHEADR